MPPPPTIVINVDALPPSEPMTRAARAVTAVGIPFFVTPAQEIPQPPRPCGDALQRRIQELEAELAAVRAQGRALAEDLQHENDDLRAENLQLLAVNTELRQTNSEQNTFHQELHTLNEEFLGKIDELTHLQHEMDHLLSSTGIGMVFLDPELRIRKFTPAITACFNMMPCDLGRPLEHITYNFAYERLHEDVRAVLTTGQPLEREVRHRQGTAFLMRILPYQPRQEGIEGVLLTFVDVTSIKQTAEALRQSEQRYRDLAESSLDALFIFSAWRDDQGQLTGFTFVDLNTRGEQMLGVPREEILGRRLGDLLPVPEGDAVERYRSVAETGTPLLEEFPCQDALGQTVWLQHQVIRFLDGIAITTRNITERKRSEAALVESEERLQGILENTPAAIYMKDLRGRYLLANRRFCELFGYYPEEGKVWTDADFLPPALAAQFRHNDRQVVISGDTQECEETLTHTDPPSTYLTVRFPVRSASGQVYAVAGIMTDITVRKGIEQLLSDRAAQLAQANDALHSQNQELDDFTYMASHDLQEPLRTMRIYSDLLGTDLGEQLPDQAAQDLEFITGAAKQMQRLIDDLLALSRTSRADMQPRRFPLRRCVLQAVTNLSARIKQAGAEIIIGELPEALGDETLLVQLYQNLIGNAVKFRAPERPPRIQIGATKKDGHWQFFVQDNGIGIRAEHRDKVFAPFQKLHSREEHEGSGIGLAICRKVVERHKGRLWVDSVPGEGSIFQFTLNVTEAAA
jgi:two-component system CheB/CheR fusion protein